MISGNADARTRVSWSFCLLVPVLWVLAVALFPTVRDSVRLYTEAVAVPADLIGAWSERSWQRHGFVEQRYLQVSIAGEIVDLPDSEVRTTGQRVWLAQVPEAPHIKRIVKGPHVTLTDAFGHLIPVLCFAGTFVGALYVLLFFVVFPRSRDGS